MKSPNHRDRAAVIGDPIRHSLSPRIFRVFSKTLGRDLEYRAMRIKSSDLGRAIKDAAEENWIGWNVTLPHKVDIMNYLDSLDSTAREVGAVNVVRFGQASAKGYNTDVEGFLDPLRRGGMHLQGMRVVVLGAGGAARAVCCALLKETIGDLHILNRTEASAKVLAKDFCATYGRISHPSAKTAVARADLIVNATSVGMDGKSSPLPSGIRFRDGAFIYDLVYRPRLTPLLKTAAASGARTIGGSGMLVAQAAATWNIWFNERVPATLLETMQKNLEETLP